MPLDFRINDLVRVVAPRRAAMGGGGVRSNPGLNGDTGTGPGGPGGSDTIPIETWDPSTNAPQLPFAWDIAERGWDQGRWLNTELLRTWMLGDLQLQRGVGAATFVRPSTTTRVTASGETEAVAIDSPAFDWLVGPDGERYALRLGDPGAILKYRVNRNMNRRAGGITTWVRHVSYGGLPGARLFKSGNWSLVDNGFGNLVFSVTQVDGVVKQATFTHEWTNNTWHAVAVGWDREAGTLKLWTDGELRVTTATTARYDELGDDLFVGDQFGTETARVHMAGFRIWPDVPSEELIDHLYALKA